MDCTGSPSPNCGFGRWPGKGRIRPDRVPEQDGGAGSDGVQGNAEALASGHPSAGPGGRPSDAEALAGTPPRPHRTFPGMARTRGGGDRAADLAEPSPRHAWMRVSLAVLVLAGMGASLVLDGGLSEGGAGPLGALAAAALVPVAVAIAVIDRRHFIIPDALNGAGLALGLVHAAAGGSVPHALARGAMLALAFLALRVGYRTLRGRDGLGLGDVKLAGVAGVWLDAWAILVAIEVAAVSALAAMGARHLAGGGRARLDGRLPFGLFFAPAIWIAWALDRMLWGGSEPW